MICKLCITSFSYISLKVVIVGVVIIVMTIFGLVTAFIVILSCTLVITGPTVPLVTIKVSAMLQTGSRRKAPLFNDDSSPDGTQKYRFYKKKNVKAN